MDGKDVLLGWFVSQRPYVAHLMAGANAMCESFFATLECELLERRRFKTQVEARMAVFDFIEGWYNPRRRHSALGYLSPNEYERLHRDQAEQSMRSATALRTAGPLPEAVSGAVQGAAVADPNPLLSFV